MVDYHNLYVQLDTMLLADTFQRFRKIATKPMIWIQFIFILQLD